MQTISTSAPSVPFKSSLAKISMPRCLTWKLGSTKVRVCQTLVSDPLRKFSSFITLAHSRMFP